MGRSRLLDFVVGGALLTAFILSCVADFGQEGDLEIFGVHPGAACLFHRFVHADCPFCGLSRGMVAMTHGRIVESFGYHPLAPCLAVCFLGFILATCIAACRRRSPIIETRLFSLFLFALVTGSVSLWGLRAIFTDRVPPLVESVVPK